MLFIYLFLSVKVCSGLQNLTGKRFWSSVVLSVYYDAHEHVRCGREHLFPLCLVGFSCWPLISNDLTSTVTFWHTIQRYTCTLWDVYWWSLTPYTFIAIASFHSPRLPNKCHTFAFAALLRCMLYKTSRSMSIRICVLGNERLRDWERPNAGRCLLIYEIRCELRCNAFFSAEQTSGLETSSLMRADIQNMPALIPSLSPSL